MHNTETKKMYCNFNTASFFFSTIPTITRIKVKNRPIDQQRRTKTEKQRTTETDKDRQTKNNKDQHKPHKPTKFLSYETIECDTNITQIH